MKDLHTVLRCLAAISFSTWSASAHGEILSELIYSMESHAQGGSATPPFKVDKTAANFVQNEVPGFTIGEEDAVQAVHAGAEADAHVTGEVAPGRLHVFASAFAVTQNPAGTSHLSFTSGSAGATMSAEYHDFVTVSLPFAPDNNLDLVIHFAWLLSVEAVTSVDGGNVDSLNFAEVDSQAILKLSGLSVLPNSDDEHSSAQDIFAYRHEHLDRSGFAIELQPKPTAVEGLAVVDIFKGTGKFSVDARMTAQTDVSIINHGNTIKPAVAGGKVDASHTLRWGGITSVTNAATGEIIADYTLSSTSGFDYRFPAPLPEPGSLLLATLAAATSCAAGQKTRRRAPRPPRPAA
jgi:hypothetical protein